LAHLTGITQADSGTTADIAAEKCNLDQVRRGIRRARPVSLNNSAIGRHSTGNAGRRNYRSSMHEDYSAVPKTVSPRLRR